MKINKKVQLGMAAVAILKNNPMKLITSKQLAEEVGTTVAFMEQVMHDLRKACITQTVKGPGGGNSIMKFKVRAIDVALAVGQDMNVPFDVENADQLTPSERLGIAIQDAYRNTVV